MRTGAEVSVTSFEQFSFEGWPVSQLAVAGAVVGALILLLSWRDFGCARRPAFVPVLLLLRLAAVAVVLVLLAGPSRVRVTEESTRRTVGIFVDTSGSMGVEDEGSDVGMARRWGLSAIREQRGNFARLDRAEAALRSVIAALDSAAGDPLSLRRCQMAIESAERWLHGTDFSTGESWAKRLGEIAETAAGQGGIPVATEILRGEILELAQAVGRVADEAAETSPIPPATPGTRLAKVRDWLQWAEGDWLGELAERSNLVVSTFDESVVRTDGAATLDSGGEITLTDLEGLLRAASASHGAGELDGVIIVSDGRHTMPGNPRRAAGGLEGVPTVIVPIGERKVRRDILIEEVQAPQFVYEDDVLEMTVTVSSYGARGERLEVTVTDGGKVVTTHQIVARTDASHHRIPLQWKAAGVQTMDLEVRVSEVDDEADRENNVKKVSVEVEDDPQKMLIADWLPRWEFRYLSNLIRRDPTAGLEELLYRPMHAAMGRELRAPPVFPSTADACDRFRLMVLGDLPPSVLTPAIQSVLKDYVVEKGGTLVVIAGDKAMPGAYVRQPLADLLPVRFKAVDAAEVYRWALTSEGEENPAVQLEPTVAENRAAWDEVARALPIYGLSPWSDPKPTARVLLEAVPDSAVGESRAFLSWHYVGRGRVVYLAAPVSYNLRYRRGDVYHFRFWGQMIRWAGERGGSDQTHPVKLELSEEEISEGGTVAASVSLTGSDGSWVAGEGVYLSIESGGEEVRRVPMETDGDRPGTYRAEIGDLPVGDLRLVAVGEEVAELLRAEGVVGNAGVPLKVNSVAAVELGNPPPDLRLLADIAAASGGIVAWPDAVPEAVAVWNLAPRVNVSRSESSAWPRWPVFWVLAGLLIAGWIVRRLIGLI